MLKQTVVAISMLLAFGCGTNSDNEAPVGDNHEMNQEVFFNVYHYLKSYFNYFTPQMIDLTRLTIKILSANVNDPSGKENELLDLIRYNDQVFCERTNYAYCL